MCHYHREQITPKENYLKSERTKTNLRKGRGKAIEKQTFFIDMYENDCSKNIPMNHNIELGDTI